MLLDEVLPMIKALCITLPASLMLLGFFLYTIRNSTWIRACFRILHRSVLLLCLITVPLVSIMMIVDLIIILSFYFGVSVYYPEQSILLSLEISMTAVIIEFCLYIIVCMGTIHFLKLNNRIQYEKFGPLGEWGAQTRRFKKQINWMPVVMGKLEPLLLPMVDHRSTLQILAPAANNGSEELALAEDLAVRLNRTIRMRTSDGSPMKHQLPVTTAHVEFTYDCIDAYRLPEVVTDPQDIIYDPKGILWFSLGKENDLLPALRLFYKLLAPDGFILIDAPEERRHMQRMNRWRLYFGLKIKYYCEGSTYGYINKCFAEGTAASKLFTLELVDGLDGPYQMAILRKRPAEESEMLRFG